MSKEVKRYYTTLAFDRPDIAANCSIQGRPATCTSYELTCVVLASDYEALLAERDALILQIDTLTERYSNSLEVIREITAALPGAYYMDPPDGGDVSIPEQVRRMAKDAERYRWLRMADWWNSPLCVIRDPKQQAKPGTDCPSRDRLDEAIDAALQGEQP